MRLAWLVALYTLGMLGLGWLLAKLAIDLLSPINGAIV